MTKKKQRKEKRGMLKQEQHDITKSYILYTGCWNKTWQKTAREKIAAWQEKRLDCHGHYVPLAKGKERIAQWRMVVPI